MIHFVIDFSISYSLSREKENGDRLQSLIDSERKTNHALTQQLSLSMSSSAALNNNNSGQSSPIKPSPLNKEQLRLQQELLKSIQNTNNNNDNNLSTENGEQAREPSESKKTSLPLPLSSSQSPIPSPTRKLLPPLMNNQILPSSPKDSKESSNDNSDSNRNITSSFPSAAEVIAQTEAILNGQNSVKFDNNSNNSKYYRMSAAINDIIGDNSTDNNNDINNNDKCDTPEEYESDSDHVIDEEDDSEVQIEIVLTHMFLSRQFRLLDSYKLTSYFFL